MTTPTPTLTIEQQQRTLLHRACLLLMTPGANPEARALQSEILSLLDTTAATQLARPQQLDNLTERFDHIYSGVSERMNQLEKRQHEDFDRHDQLAAHVGKLDNDLTERTDLIEEQQSEVNCNFDNLTERLDKLESSS